MEANRINTYFFYKQKYTAYLIKIKINLKFIRSTNYIKFYLLVYIMLLGKACSEVDLYIGITFRVNHREYIIIF